MQLNEPADTEAFFTLANAHRGSLELLKDIEGLLGDLRDKVSMLSSRLEDSGGNLGQLAELAAGKPWRYQGLIDYLGAHPCVRHITFQRGGDTQHRRLKFVGVTSDRRFAFQDLDSSDPQARFYRSFESVDFDAEGFTLNGYGSIYIFKYATEETAP